MQKQGYVVGSYANRPELPPFEWNPDHRNSINPHLLISAASGAGKTTLLKDISRYLALSGKHIFIFDLKGDMIIKDDNDEVIGNYIEFTSWNSPYGLNPFEFDTGISESELRAIVEDGVEITKEQRFKVQNSGPKVQVERLIAIIKKNFLPVMSTKQKDIFMYLFSDTYKSKGFIYNDINTWLNDLPSLNDTLDLIERINSYAYEGAHGVVLDGDSIKFVSELSDEILKIKALEADKSLTLDDAEEDAVEDMKYIYDGSNQKINALVKKYVEHGVENFHQSTISENKAWFEERGINIDIYMKKDILASIEKLASYISALVDAEVFGSNKPPVKAGLNVVNISGLDVPIQRFIVDVWLGKVFTSCKIRGTYSERKNKSRGEKCDTFVIIDESKLIAGNSREKNDPFSFLNRIATESRGFGLALVVAAQSAEHFPAEFLKNFDAQIILNTSIADFDSVRKSFGLDKALLEYTQNGFGNALVKVGKKFNKIKLAISRK